MTVIDLTPAPAPVVSGFQVNDGNVQRSMVDSLTVTFNQPVTLVSGAIALNKLLTGGGTLPMSFAMSSPDGGTTWVLKFTNPSYIGGSLPDGAYALTITGSAVTSISSGQAMIGTTTENFYRLYGDFNGTGVVDISDFSIFASLFGLPTPASLWYVDYNADGVIDITDFNAFSQNFGLQAVIPSDITTAATTNTATSVAASPFVFTTTTPSSAQIETAKSSALLGTARIGSGANVHVASGHGPAKKPRRKQ
jgi:hypothetical protein